MHAEAHDYVSRFATDRKVSVIDVGSLDINGTVRDLFPHSRYTGIDVVDGRAVDRVVDGAVWTPRTKVDVVVCCEMLEHCDQWPTVIHNIADNMLKSGGRLIVTAANLSREPHSGIDGGPLHPDEFYENIDPVILEQTMIDAGFVDIELDVSGTDVRATGLAA